MNNIEMLNIDVVACTEAPVIQEHVANFFKHLLTEQEGWRPKLDGLVFESIEPQDVFWLEKPFEEMEVHGVVRGIRKDKALGFDSFYMGFFQSVWDVVKRI